MNDQGRLTKAQLLKALYYIDIQVLSLLRGPEQFDADLDELRKSVKALFGKITKTEDRKA